MTLWFGPFVDMRPDYGYFHLCPSCYGRHVKPHLDQVQGRLAEFHPMTHRPADDPAADPADTIVGGGGQIGVEEGEPEGAESRSSRS